MTFEQAKGDIRLSGDIAQLGEAAARIAINDGLAMYTQEQTKAEKAKTDKKVEYKKAVPVKGAVRIAEDVKVTSSMKANMPILKRIARSGNVAVVIERFSGAESASKGYYDGVLHLNAEKLSEGGFSYTGIHESVHHVARVNPEGYKSIEKFIENFYKEKGVDINAEIKATQDLYKRRGVKLTAEEAMEEIVCNTLSDIATDEDALTAFMGLDGKAQNKFIEALKAIARKLKEWANKCLGNTEYHSIVLKDADTLLSLAKQLRSELYKAGTRAIDSNITEKSMSLLISDKFKQRLLRQRPRNVSQKTWAKIEAKRKQVYSSLNGEDIPMIDAFDIAEYNKIDDSKRYYIYNIDKDNFYVISITNTPDAKRSIQEDGEHSESYTENRKVDFRKSKYRIGISDNTRQRKIFVGGDRAVGRSKDATGISDVVGRGQRDNNIGLSLYGTDDISNNSVGRISGNKKHYFSSFDEEYLTAVESGDTETAQRLVDEAAEVAMKDSKIRDKSGKLVKVYHGSDSADFYEFDKQRRGQTDSSMYGRGYYFAFDPDYSSDFGDNIREFYLDIKNPFYIDINAPAKVIADFLISKGVDVDFDYRNMICHFFAKNFGSQKFADTLVGLGFDGVIVRTDEGDYWETVAFHRNQMKLADAVTYDNNGNVIPISERFDFEKKDIRYSFGEDINTDYSDLSKLDDKSRKVYNDRGWAKQLLSAEDWALYNEHIGYKLPKDSKCFKNELADGSLVLEINNKVLIVNGQYGSDEIYGVLAINAPSEGHANWIKEALYNDTEGLWLSKESYGEVCESLQDVFGERVVRYYNGDDYSYRKGQYHSKQRATLPSYWENYGYTKDKRDGAGVSSEAQRGVPGAVSKVNDKSYSFGEEDLDYGTYVSEEREGAENLKESDRAVGGLFEATREAKLEEAEINRVLNRHLKNFKVTAELESHRARVAQIVSLAERQDYVDGGAVVGEIATVMKDAVIDSNFCVRQGIEKTNPP